MAKTWNEMDDREKDEVVELFANWLKDYTQSVINRVIPRRDEILANDTAMVMLFEMKKREEKEQKDFKRSIDALLDDFDGYKEYDPHNHVLDHSQSYRDVLRDMYITY